MNQRFVGLVLITGALWGCGKDDACPKAKQAATTALVAAIGDSDLEVGRLRAEETLTRGGEDSAQALADVRESWTASLALFEEGLDCVAHADCCDRLVRKRGQPAERLARKRAAADLHGVHVPLDIRKFHAPIAAVMDTTDAVFGDAPDAAAVKQWCDDARAAIASAVAEAAPVWDRLIAAATAEATAAQDAVEAHDSRRKTLEAWSTAVLRSGPTDPAAGPTDGPPSFVEARATVARYQTACH